MNDNMEEFKEREFWELLHSIQEEYDLTEKFNNVGVKMMRSLESDQSNNGSYDTYINVMMGENNQKRFKLDKYK